MELMGTAELGHSPQRVHAAVAILDGYDKWLGIVRGAAALPPAPDDAGPAWLVDLEAGIGPIRQTKRVRMVRTHNDPPRRVVFERHEDDGADHSPWVLTADVLPSAAGARLQMHIFYGGARWLPGLDVVLRREVRAAGGRLEKVLRD